MARRFVPRRVDEGVNPQGVPVTFTPSLPARPDAEVERIMREAFGAEADKRIEEMRKASPLKMPAKKKAKKTNGDVIVEIVITVRMVE